MIMNLMSATEELIDKYSGMITTKQAESIIENNAGDDSGKIPETISVKSLLEFLNNKNSALGIRTVNVQDYIYRIFNPFTYSYSNRQGKSRSLVLGSEGSTIKLNLAGKASDFIDIGKFERGDLVLMKNLLLDSTGSELNSGSSTIISRINPAPARSTISDYSLLKEGLKNIDVLGKLIEMNPIRYINSSDGSGQIAVTDCVISDMNNTANVSLWESSALATAGMNVNDFIKIEFCSVRFRNRIEIYASNLSRIVSGKGFANRLRQR